MDNITPEPLAPVLQRCETCGTRARSERLSISFMLHRLREDVFGAERGLFVTVWHLFTRPQDVISGFIKGDNLRYYSPIKYFVVMIAVSLFLPNDSVLDDFVTGLVQSLKIFDPEVTRKFVSDWNALVYLPMVMMLAISTRFFFRAKDYNFAEHLVVAAYGWAQMVLLGAVAFSTMHLLTSLGVDARIMMPLFFAPYLYWFWYCRSVFSQQGVAGWLRAFATLPVAVISYILLVAFTLVSGSVFIKML